MANSGNVVKLCTIIKGYAQWFMKSDQAVGELSGSVRQYVVCHDSRLELRDNIAGVIDSLLIY